MRLPDDFRLGFSTSAYQIEGGVDQGGRGTSIWDRFCRLDGTIESGHTGDQAADHYSRFREDVALVKEAGVSDYRFSVAWPRVQPEGRGLANVAGLDFYDRLVDLLLEADVEPWVCLYHWDLPAALQDRGGWPNRDLVYRFSEYALLVCERLGDRVRRWAPMNEPSVVAVMGHLQAVHAPGLSNLDACLACAHHLNLATAESIRALRSSREGLRLGTILSWNCVEPATDEAADLDAAEIIDGFLHRGFADPLWFGSYPEAIRGAMKPVMAEGDAERVQVELDWLGINYYTRLRARAALGGKLLGASVQAAEEGVEATDMGWEVFPEGLYQVLLDVDRRYARAGLAPGNRLELFVTENGAAFADEVTENGHIHDGDRISYLRRHLEQCLAAVERGVDLGGYFAWSLLDNFEWSEGYDKRFGLVWVDYETFDRTPKDSYEWFRQVATGRELF